MSWAKVTDFADSPAQAEAVRTQTVADRHKYLESGMQPLRCAACRTEVLVRKNSYAHTSIQWSADAATSCPEFAGAAQGRRVGDSCPRLRQTIEHAVLEGIVTVDADQ